MNEEKKEEIKGLLMTQEEVNEFNEKMKVKERASCTAAKLSFKFPEEQRIKELYEKLSTKLPKEAFREFKKEETGLNYDIKSHNYQYAVNRMNDVIGHENWQYSEDNIKEEKLNGKWIVSKRIIVQIGKWHFLNGLSQWELKNSKFNYGFGISDNLGDAHKMAITNGLKKTLAMFGVGKETYEQTIDVDFANIKEVEMKKTEQDVFAKLKAKIANAKNVDDLNKLKNVIEETREIENKSKTELVKHYNEKLIALK